MEKEVKFVSEDLQDFINKLQLWAINWIDDVNNVVVQHIDELFDDEAVVHLVNLYAQEKATADRMNKNYLLSAYRFNETIVKSPSDFSGWINSALYELCYKRYTRNDTEKENE